MMSEHPRPALDDDVQGPAPREQIQRVAPKMFAKAEPDGWKYVKWSDPVHCLEENIEPVADKIATTKFADKRRSRWDPEPLGGA